MIDAYGAIKTQVIFNTTLLKFYRNLRHSKKSKPSLRLQVYIKSKSLIQPGICCKSY